VPQQITAPFLRSSLNGKDQLLHSLVATLQVAKSQSQPRQRLGGLKLFVHSEGASRDTVTPVCHRIQQSAAMVSCFACKTCKPRRPFAKFTFRQKQIFLLNKRCVNFFPVRVWCVTGWQCRTEAFTRLVPTALPSGDPSHRACRTEAKFDEH
jgi:hypothetical protein